MSVRLLMPKVFKVFGTVINWNREADMHHNDHFLYDGPGDALTHLRWLVNPSLGLAQRPFQVFRRPFSEEPLDLAFRRQLAQLDDWDLVEVVGLPVDTNDGEWANVYDSGPQGLIGVNGSASDSPFDAAIRRLKDGAPRLGWDSLSIAGLDLPVWENAGQSPDLENYLFNVQRSPLMEGLRDMLANVSNPPDHHTFVINDSDPGGVASRLAPRLIVAPHSSTIDHPSRTNWHPLQLMSLGAATDPFASLALGFGTALNDPDKHIYMVTVVYDIPGIPNKTEYADVIAPDPLPDPDAPTGLTVVNKFQSRPARTDGPLLESIEASWDRPARLEDEIENIFPTGVGVPPKAHLASYAVGRFRLPDVFSNGSADILLEERRDAGGWQPYAPASRVADQGKKKEIPPQFTDHLLREAVNNQGQRRSYPFGIDLTYVVAVQDLFGRWSTWSTANVSLQVENPQEPAVVGVSLDPPAGLLDILFSWDWSDRSPQFVELLGNYADQPGSTLFSVRVDFNGSEQPTAPHTIEPFQLLPKEANEPWAFQVHTNNQTLTPAPEFGEAQDRDPSDPSTRYYRLRLPFTFDFGGLEKRTLLVRARGKTHLVEIFDPGGPAGISVFSPSEGFPLTQYNPTPPVFQVTPVEVPLFASLPDAGGLNRFILSWPETPGVLGYVVYEASETTLLAATSGASPDLLQPLTTRLANLRSLIAQNLGKIRPYFRRVQPELIEKTPGDASVRYEVILPRGSQVMQFYFITAVSPNKIETEFPGDSKAYIAVAAPRLAVPPPPVLQAIPDLPSGAVQLPVELPAGQTIAKVELFRTTRSDIALTSVDSYGPPISTPPPQVNGTRMIFTDPTSPVGWNRIYYRAVIWAADNVLAGVIGARSTSSTAQAVLIPPANMLPDLADFQVNLEGSTENVSLVSWTSRAPVKNTDLGPHTLAFLIGDNPNAPLSRFDSPLEKVPEIASRAALPAPTAAIGVFRVTPAAGQPVTYFAWAPRPAAGQTYQVTVKIVDPLGSVSRDTKEVPRPPFLPLLSPITFVDPSHFSVANITAATWEILSTLDMSKLEQYILRVELGNPAHITTFEKNLKEINQVPPNFNPPAAQMLAALAQILRVQDTQTYVKLMGNVHNLLVTVTLTDPDGRQVTQQGELP